MDCYQILRVPPNASSQEIEKAYKRLLKEAKYDTTINRTDVENAYRVLGNETQRKIYDAKLGVSPPQKLRKRRKRKLLQKLTSLTRSQLLAILVVLFLIQCLFYGVRFGYEFKTFEVGDEVYDILTGNKMGKIIEAQANHQFYDVKLDAYLIEMEPTKEKIWYSQDEIKLHCRRVKTGR